MIGVVSALDQGSDIGRGGAACHGLHIHINTFLLFPIQPSLERSAVSVGRSGHNEHLHRRCVEVGVVIVGTADRPAVEQHVIDASKIRAVSVNQHFLGGHGIGTVETDFHFNVVEHTQGVVDGVITDRLNGHFAQTNAAHGAFHADKGLRLRTQPASLIGILIVDKRYFLWPLVLAQRRLTRHQGLDAIVFETVVGRGIARHSDAGYSTEGNGDEFVHDGNLRVALIAADDGVGHRKP